MNIKSFIKPIFLIPALGMILYSCSSSTEKQAESAQESDEQIEVVRVTELEFTEIARKITYTAHLEAFSEVHLASAAPGRIDKIHVEASNRISQGQLLVEMDKTQLQQAMLQLKSIEVDYHRLDTLRRAGSVSQQQFDQIRTQYELAQSNVAFLQDNTRLVAPFSGVVSGKYFENGEMFSGAPNTAEGKAAILSIMQTSRLKARVNVAERFYPFIKRGMEVSLSSDVYPGEEFIGAVSAVYPQIDPATRTFRIEVTVPNPAEKLRPGMFSRASLELEQVNVFVVPSLAILKLQGANERYVFIAENGVARRVVVELGERFDDRVEVISDDIKAGDQLIIAGHSRLLDGNAIEIKE